jgi:hypothetical protein
MKALQNMSLRKKMNLIYKDICGFDIPKVDANLVRESHGSPVYGEINLAAMGKLLDYLQLNEADCNLY